MLLNAISLIFTHANTKWSMLAYYDRTCLIRLLLKLVRLINMVSQEDTPDYTDLSPSYSTQCDYTTPTRTCSSHQTIPQHQPPPPPASTHSLATHKQLAGFTEQNRQHLYPQLNTGITAQYNAHNKNGCTGYTGKARN